MCVMDDMSNERRSTNEPKQQILNMKEQLEMLNMNGNLLFGGKQGYLTQWKLHEFYLMNKLPEIF